jgi:FMN phosphatase YigB (HAD superfamily)
MSQAGRPAWRRWLGGLDLPASEVLFIDDGVRNVEAAASLGMHAEIARNPADARSVLVKYGVVL